MLAGPEQAVLVLGPPRSGKTSAIVVPTVLGSESPVVSTSTKPDVLSTTVAHRRRRGPCLLYDPSGEVPAPPGVERVGWSPVGGCDRWDVALLRAQSMVGATRARPGRVDANDHWSERAGALLAPLLHAAALEGEPLSTVLKWIDRRQAAPALRALDDGGAAVAGDVLAGIAATDAREQSAIWSTTSGVLAAYRSEAALATTRTESFDAASFCRAPSTLYICATGRHQALAAPLVVGLLTEVRTAAYEANMRATGAAAGLGAPVVLALDEVANIAPIPDLPAMVSEGGSQGVVTMACLQDLSQARVRWGEAADGFLSLFGTTVVLPGIGDLRTLETLSALAGTGEVATRSISEPVPPGAAAVSLSRRLVAAGAGRGWRADVPGRPTITTSVRSQPRLPVDEVGRGRPGMAVVVDERNRIGWVQLTPWFAHEPWRSLALGLEPGRDRERAQELGQELGRPGS